jgi:hypothetical protein
MKKDQKSFRTKSGNEQLRNQEGKEKNEKAAKRFESIQNEKVIKRENF